MLNRSTSRGSKEKAHSSQLTSAGTEHVSHPTEGATLHTERRSAMVTQEGDAGLPHAQPQNTQRRVTVCASEEFTVGKQKETGTPQPVTPCEETVFTRGPTGSTEETFAGRQILTESHRCAGTRPSPGGAGVERTRSPSSARECHSREMSTRHSSSQLRPKEQRSGSTNTPGIQPQLRGA